MGARADPVSARPSSDRPVGLLQLDAHQAATIAYGQTELTHPRGITIRTTHRTQDLTAPASKHDEVPVPVVAQGEPVNRAVGQPMFTRTAIPTAR